MRATVLLGIQHLHMFVYKIQQDHQLRRTECRHRPEFACRFQQLCREENYFIERQK